MSATQSATQTIDVRTDEVAPEPNELEQLARQLAEQHKQTRPGKSGKSLLSRLEIESKILHDAYDHFGKTSREELSLSYAAEWVLDNFYLVNQTLRQIEE